MYVDDHSDALLTVLEKGRVGETYNIGGNNERTNLELVETLCDLIDAERGNEPGKSRSLIRFVTDRPGHDRRYAVNAAKIKSELGWSPSVEWNEGFKATLLWYLKNEKWWKPLVKDGMFGDRIGLENKTS